MLLAEIHGLGIPEAVDHEDLLTSTVFGHLRYIPPKVFWADFFSRAVSLPSESGEVSLQSRLDRAGLRVENYSSLRTIFWGRHPELGCPDLILCFTGPAQRPMVLVVECKLWAEKSGSGEADQLGRYLNLARDLKGISPPLTAEELRDPFFAVLYLTPRESRAEVEETARLRERFHDRNLLFRAQWQDIIECFSKAELHPAPDPMWWRALGDVVAFLRRRGLEYFRGFRSCAFDALPAGCGCFYSGSGSFRRREELKSFSVQKARWVEA
jgi:hypothetical protein